METMLEPRTSTHISQPVEPEEGDCKNHEQTVLHKVMLVMQVNAASGSWNEDTSFTEGKAESTRTADQISLRPRLHPPSKTSPRNFS